MYVAAINNELLLLVLVVLELGNGDKQDEQLTDYIIPATTMLLAVTASGKGNDADDLE